MDVNMNFKFRKNSGIGEIKLNKKKVKTPLLMFGYRIGDRPKAWLNKDINIDSLMLNAYEFVKNNGRSEKVLEQGIHAFLNFNKFVIMDSGGFYFLKSGNIDVQPLQILEYMEKSGCDMGVTLDFPLEYSNKKENKKRIEITVKNSNKMIEESKIPLMTVIHGFSSRQIDYFTEKLNYDPEIIGLGSQAGLLYPFRINEVKKIIDTAIYVRKKYPNRFFHLLGIGSPRLVPIFFLIGVDSLDAKTWLWKAVRHMIYYRGRIVCVKNDGNSWTPSYNGENYHCDCPVCRKYGFSGLIGEDKWVNRGLHNAWTYQEEIKTIRKKIEEGELSNYVETLLKGTIYKNVYHYTVKKIHNEEIS
ncbi:MAG TPA: tRNA-guanine transglycosylase [Candidatus Atribacteria bacterium]|nr:tRNA-guanine transglycosylase [Candidatus Atribacteria bacterium]